MMKHFVEQFGDCFWTVIDEMIEDIEEAGYEVLDANDEYLVIDEDEDIEFLVYLGRANRTIWIGSVIAK